MKTLAAVLTVMMVASATFAQTASEQSAVLFLEQGKPESAIKIAQSESASTRGRILLCAAHAQKYDQSKNPRSMKEATQAYKKLLHEVTVDDAVLLHTLRTLKGSMLHSYSETLLDQALRRIETPEQAKAVPAALRVVYRSERYKVYAGLSDWLASQRERLLSGGTLDAEAQKVFTDEELIGALVDLIDAKKKSVTPSAKIFASPRPGGRPMPEPRTDLSRVQPPRTNATARECLILIEEPAIPIVREKLPQLGDEGVSLLSELCAAKTLRESKAPGFAWSSPCGE